MSKNTLWKTRKIRTISIDTDVISDVLYREILLKKQSLAAADKIYLSRANQLFEILNLAFNVNVRTALPDK
jgi:hypothetical protein